MHHVTHMNVPHGKHTCVVHVVPSKPKGMLFSVFFPYFLFILFWIVGVAWERGEWCAHTRVMHSHACFMSHIWMSHDIHINTSHCTDACVMPHTWLCHAAHLNAPGCPHECAMLHTRMRHVAHMNVPFCTHECAILHTCTCIACRTGACVMPGTFLTHVT